MIVYNVTTNITWAIHDEWLSWMKQQHIPEMLQTGYFVKHQMLRLKDIDESDGPTYAVQYYSDSDADLQAYFANRATQMREKATGKWGKHAVSFRTIMEVIN